VHHLTARHILAVTLAADAPPRFTGKHGADQHFLDAGILNFTGQLFRDHLVAGTNHLVGIGIEHVIDRHAPHQPIAQAFQDGATVARVREVAAKAKLGIDRVVIEQGSLDKLPYADNMVDLLLATQTTDSDLAKLSAEEVLRVLRPLGVAVVIEAQHLCMMMRGVQKQNSVTTTSDFTGAFRKVETREEFIHLIGTKLH